MPRDTTTTTHPRRPRLGAAVAAAALAALLAGCGAAPAATPPPPQPAPESPAGLTTRDVDAWLDGVLPAALEREGVAGATVAVVADGEVVTTRGYGWADTGRAGGEDTGRAGGEDTGRAGGDGTGAPVPVDPEESLFRVGSVSKLFTAVAVAQLVDEGRLDLDVDVARYLDFEVPRRFPQDLTLRHLLTHTGGFEERFAGTITFDEPVELREVLATDPPEQVFAPGTTPAYSNYGNALAGYVVERVTGTPFAEHVEDAVLAPLGMTSSTFAQPLPAELEGRLSQSYADASGAPQPFDVVGPSPAGSLTASGPDMARFMLALLGDLPGGEAVIGEAERELLLSPALDESSLGDLAAGARMGLGAFDESRGGHRAYGHGGDTTHFHSQLHVLPDDGAGIFVSFNSSGSDGLATAALRRDLVEAFDDRYVVGGGAQTTPVAARTAPDGAAGRADAVAGRYVDTRGSATTFLAALGALGGTTVEVLPDGRLLATPGPGSVAPAVYEEVEPWLWREVGSDRTLPVRVEDGAVTGVGYEGAFTLRPATAAEQVGLPVVAAAALVMLVALVALPVGAVVRRRRGRPAPPRALRLLRAASWAAALSGLLALAGWAGAITAITSFAVVPGAAVRALQGLQLLAALGLVPAAARVVAEIRGRTGWARAAGALVLLLALGATAWAALSLGLLSPSATY
ncbi:serine hydrolase [uncultured Pseudokineococcus sp.]|uniref:serine hydrolase domain-containing protein n=1 Tax=uncultured Pseudokineococcus sp. TaxID=1642928 RepID=UPI00260AD123|nr:serine hydrolase domain-containing protein [uncultured Pseudokineococcus sp.]